MAEPIQMEKITVEAEAPAFDFDGAIQAGASKQDILRYLERNNVVDFDFKAARQAGASDDEIFDYVYKPSATSYQEDVSNIAPGMPESEYADEQQASQQSQEPSIISLPENMAIDTKQTIPTQGMPSYSASGDIQMTQVSKDQPEYSYEQQMETERTKRQKGTVMERSMQSGLQQPAEGAAYIDPATGKPVDTSTQAGAIDTSWDILFGPAGKLGFMGILQPGIGAELGKAGLESTSKLASKAITMVDDYLSKSRFSQYAGDQSGLSKEARIIVGRHSNNPEITPEYIDMVLAGVPTKDQAYILSRALGEQNYIKQAVRGDGDTVAAALRADLTRGKVKVQSAIGDVDVPGAMARYSDMMTMVEREGTQNVRPANNIASKVDQLLQETYLIPDRGQQTALRLKVALERNGNRMSLLDALEYRPEINELLRKARNHNEKANLKVIKDELDTFIEKLATPEQKAQIDDAISYYANTMQNKEAMELIQKNTDPRGIGVNWTKLHSDMADANLRTPEAVNALRIAEAFSKKFGNDKALVNIALPQGSSPDAGGALGAWGAIVNGLKNHFAFWGNRADNLRIQKAIVNTIKNSKTNYDFVDKLKANKNIPEEFKEVFLLPYKPGAKQTGDVNLEPMITPVGGYY